MIRRLICALAALTIASPLFAAVDPAARGLAVQAKTQAAANTVALSARAVTVPLDTSGASAAAANVTIMQAALDGGGLVQATCSGTAFINATLKIGDNTNLQLAPSCTIKQAPSINKSMLRTKSSLATASSITVAWTSGRMATVTMAGHGLVLGQSLWIKGSAANASDAAFLGVFPIVSVVDANTVTVRLRRVPTAAPTVALTGVAANRNITVGGGGLWDYDYANNGGSTAVDTQAIVMVGVSGVDVDLRVQNAQKYCLTLSAVANWRAKLVIPTTRSDGFKVYGPAFDGEIVGQRGIVGDDFISFQPKEATGFLTYPLSEGDIIGVKGGNLSLTSGPSTTGILTFYAHNIYTIDEFDLAGVTGQNAYRAVNMRNSGDVTGGTAKFGDVRVTGISAQATFPVYIDGVLADRLEFGLSNAMTDGDTGTNGSQTILQTTTVDVIKSLTVNMYLKNTGYNGSAYYPIFLRGTLSEFKIRGNVELGSSSPFIGVGNAATIQRYIFDGLNLVASQAFKTTVAAPITPDLLFIGGYYNTSNLVSIYANTNVTLLGPTIYNANLGVIRFNATATVNLKSSGSLLTGTSIWATAPGGTPTLYISGEEVQNVGIGATYTSASVAPPLSSTRALRLALDKIRNGSAAAGPLVVVGDSTDRGPNNVHTQAWPYLLAQGLNANGIPTSTDSFFGASNITTTAAMTTADPRLAFGTGWIINTRRTAGGNDFEFPASTAPAPLSFTPSVAFDQCDIYAWQNSGASLGSFAVDRSGTSPTTNATYNTNTTPQSIAKVTVTWATAAAGTVNVQASSSATGALRVQGMVCRNTAAPKLEIVNAGWAGSSSLDWVSGPASVQTGAWSPLSAIQSLAPVAVIYGHQVNDFNSGTTQGGNTGPTSLSTFTSDITTFTTGLPNATFIFARKGQNNPSTFASVTTQDSYWSAVKDTAANISAGTVDMQAVAGPWSTANGDGLMLDDRHFNLTGNQRGVRELLRLFLRM